MNREKIKFDRLWAKLKRTTLGDIFTTWRRYTPSKEIYYLERVGKIFEIEITNTSDGFKGFNGDGLLLIFRAVGSITGRGKDNINEAKLLQVIRIHADKLSEEFKGYDTEILEGIVR